MNNIGGIKGGIKSVDQYTCTQNLSWVEMCGLRPDGAFFAPIFCIVFMFIGCLAQDITTSCASNPGTEVECSSAITGDCTLTEESGPPMNIEDDRPPDAK